MAPDGPTITKLVAGSLQSSPRSCICSVRSAPIALEDSALSSARISPRSTLAGVMAPKSKALKLQSLRTDPGRWRFAALSTLGSAEAGRSVAQSCTTYTKKAAADRVPALRFAPVGTVEDFAAPTRHALARTGWWMNPLMRSDAACPPLRKQVLEDTPFYARARTAASLCGENVVAMHETLDLRRLMMPIVQVILPWRMPRRR